MKRETKGVRHLVELKGDSLKKGREMVFYSWETKHKEVTEICQKSHRVLRRHTSFRLKTSTASTLAIISYLCNKTVGSWEWIVLEMQQKGLPWVGLFTICTDVQYSGCVAQKDKKELGKHRHTKIYSGLPVQVSMVLYTWELFVSQCCSDPHPSV